MPTGWQGSERRSTLPADWAVTCFRILRRDHHRCQWIRVDTDRRCLAQARDVDHIISHADGGSDDDSNLQSLCEYHHRKKTGREGGIASGRSRRAKRDSEKPLHPGLIPAQPAFRDDGPAPF